MAEQTPQLSERWDGWRRRLAGDRRFTERGEPVLSDRWDAWRRRLDGADADRRRAASERRAGARLFAVSALVAAGAVTLVLWGPPDAGPLETSGGTGTAIHLAPGEPFHDQTGVLSNPTDRPIELISVRRVGVVGSPDAILRVVAGSVPGRPRVPAGGGALSPAYARALRRAEGFRIPARSAALITTTGRLAAGESYGIGGYDIAYRAGRTVFGVEVSQVFAACASPDERCDSGSLMDRLFDDARFARDG